jgi:hypothetical protein
MMQIAAVSTVGDISFSDAKARIRAEFIEMPGLQLTLAQASRLWHLERDFCDAILTALVEGGFLVRTRGLTFARS